MPGGDKKGAGAAVVASALASRVDEIAADTLEHVRQRLWQALPTVANVVAAQTTADRPTSAENGRSEEAVAEEALVNGLTVPWTEVRDAVGSLFTALHTNPTPEDTQRAVEEVVGTEQNPPQPMYTRADLFSFLDTLPLLWLPSYAEALKMDGGSDRVRKLFNAALISCVTQDEEPCRLLTTEKTLTLHDVPGANTPFLRPTALRSPVADFVKLLPPVRHPVVYDQLWRCATGGDDTASTLSFDQFGVFFEWFYTLHFDNSTSHRSRAAAVYFWHSWLNERGQMDIDSFMRTCSAMCASLAKQREAAAYLAELVTTVTDASGSHTSLSFVLDEPALQAVESKHPRTLLSDPEALFLPEDLRPWHRETEAFNTGASRNRVVVYGKRCARKSAVGKALAAKLNAVHLDVLEIAVKTVLSAASGGASVGATEVDGAPNVGQDLTQQLLDCVDESRAVPIALQAALLRREALSPATSFRGYVLSDTVASLPMSGPSESVSTFIEESGLATELVPTAFVELLDDNEEWTEEARVALAAEADAAAFARAEAAQEHETETIRREMEAREMRVSCKSIIDHHQSLQKQENVQPEELETAKQQASEAEEILAQLDAENVPDETAAGQESAQGTDRDEAREAAESKRVEAILRHLILAGRAAVHELTPSATSLSALTSQADCLAAALPCWRHAVDSAAVLHRVLSVGGMSSSPERIVSYLVEALQLECTVLPADPIVAANNASLTTQWAAAEGNGDEEEQGTAKELAAQELGCTASPLWKRFCPVTYEEEAVLVEGAACFSCVYRGRSYYCTSHARLRSFMANPTMYLRNKQSTSSGQRVLLVAGAGVDGKSLFASAASEQAFLQQLANALQLTQVSLQQYADCVSQYCALRERRRNVVSTRTEYDAAERAGRDERLQKRLKLESKKRKTANPSKPKLKKPAPHSAGSAAHAKVSIVEPSLLEGSAPEKEKTIPVVPTLSPMERTLQAVIEQAKTRLRDVVPVMVPLLNATEEDVELCAVLQRERCLPECVIVLEAAHQEEAGEPEENTEDGETPREPTGASTAPLEPWRKILAMAPAADAESGVAAAALAAGSSSGEAPAEWKRRGDGAGESLPVQSFVRCRTTVPGNAPLSVDDEHSTLRAILQSVCPTSLLPADGAVDEELGMADESDMDGDEEEEDEAEQNAADDNGDADGTLNPSARFQGAVAAVAKPDPRLKARRRYLDQFGTRLEYCPVTLLEKNLLVRGRTEICLKFLDRLYCFADESCKERFLRDPMRFAEELPPRSVPPRLWVTGTRLSGKHTLAQGLHDSVGIHHFAYNRGFFTRCIEAAQAPGGGVVDGIVIPEHAADNPYVRKAAELLNGVRDRAAEEEKGLKLRAEAEAVMAERERREEERAEREAAGDYSEGEEEETVDEEKESLLQTQLEFEPEDPEEAQIRLTEAYLRMASNVTRFEPFESSGYLMITPPFSEADLDIVFEEGCVPEAVIHLDLESDELEKRVAGFVAAQKLRESDEKQAAYFSVERAASTWAHSTKVAEKSVRDGERKLRQWRRRHIGEEDDNNGAEASGDEGEDEPVDGTEEDGAGGVASPFDEAARADELEAIAEFLAQIRERVVPLYTPNANVGAESLLRATLAALGRHLKNRLSFFSSVEVIEHAQSVRMLQQGTASLSAFGRSDPVRLSDERAGAHQQFPHWPMQADGDVSAAFVPESAHAAFTCFDSNASDLDDENRGDEEAQELEEEMSELDPDELEEMRERLQRKRAREAKKAAPRCGLVCGRVYYFDSDETFSRFIANPLLFAECAPPAARTPAKLPIVAIYDDIASTAGAPRKTPVRVPLAEAVAANTGSVLLTTSSLLAWAAALPDNFGPLSAHALRSAMDGSADDGLVAQLLLLRLCSAEVRQRGAVLHNLPWSVHQVEVLCGSPHCPPIAASVRFGNEEVCGLPLQKALQRLQACGTLIPTVSVPYPSAPMNPANLTELIRGINNVSAHEAVAQLRRQRAFPLSLEGLYVSTTEASARLSNFKDYCCYGWVRDGNLVALPSSVQRCVAEYLGKYYVLSDEGLLAQFLVHPEEVTDPGPNTPPFPTTLPRAVSSDSEEAAQAPLACKGCCPVRLYDTRDQRGLRGDVAPQAKMGSRAFLAEYDGAFYACLSKDNLDRFLQRPWQYTTDVTMPEPRKCPLTDAASPTEEAAAAAELSDEDYTRRWLYDAVAHAMVAVADARPQYPGMSEEESALKYMSLFMKAQRETNSEIEQKQYTDNFSVFAKRAAFYQRIEKASADTASPAALEELCDDYENMRKGVKAAANLGHLKGNLHST